MKNRLTGVKDEPWQKPEQNILVKLDAVTGKVADSDSKEIVEEKVKKEPKAHRYDENDNTGFEVFSDMPIEELAPIREADPNYNTQRGNSLAPTPQRRKPEPEKVEIPEQLF